MSADLIARVEGVIAGLPTTPCDRCGQPVVRGLAGPPRHRAKDGMLNRGCRAASFDPDAGARGTPLWNDDLPRHWTAK